MGYVQFVSDFGQAPSAVDRSEHLAALHARWVTPVSAVEAAVRDVTTAPVAEVRRIVAGEQNEVYDVAFQRAPSLIVRISQDEASHSREAWVIAQCLARGIRVPRIHARRSIDVGREPRSLMVMEKLPGQRLGDVDRADVDIRRTLEEVGAWLRQLHSIPVRGFGYLDGSGVGKLPTVQDGLTRLMGERAAFEDAGGSVGIDAATIRSLLREIVESLQATPPRVALIHNDLLADHVLVDDGHLSGVIDFGEVAAEPAANDFAKWDFSEGDRFPVAWMQAGYGDRSLFDPPHDRTYRALWIANGLWRMRWYHETGFPAGVEAARDRLLPEQQP